jgi:uncharacterized protein (TIGR00661 family)
MNTPKKFVFLVQGEGRGHMTQAISLCGILTSAGHQVMHVFIGRSDRRKIPAYFIESFSCPVNEIDSPNFITDKNHKSIRLIPSILYNTRFLGRYFRSLRLIHQVVKMKRPDYVINFYEFLGGFYHTFYRTSSRHITVGHQMLAGHPAFPYAPGRRLDRILFKINNWLMSLNAHKKLALSFSEYVPARVNRTVVCPPLLRDDLLKLNPEPGSFILGYMVNDGYYQQIMEWHENHRNIKIHCFWDRKGEPQEKMIHENLVFHQLSAEKFLHLMAKCGGLVTTAGFESICEAMYLGKPVMMIPVEGQYEQACNALDAIAAGAGISCESFNISRLIDYIPEYRSQEEKFKNWLSKTSSIVLRELS